MILMMMMMIIFIIVISIIIITQISSKNVLWSSYVIKLFTFHFVECQL